MYEEHFLREYGDLGQTYAPVPLFIPLMIIHAYAPLDGLLAF